MPPLFVRAANRMLPTDAAVRLHEPLDQAFGIINRAIQKRVALVRDTDLAVIFPECLARQLNTTKAFRLLTLPFDLPPVQIMLHTHSRFASDVGINWLRDTLVTMLAKAG